MSVLIIKNKAIVDSEWQQLIEQTYPTYTVNDPWEGQDLLSEHAITLPIIQLDEGHISPLAWDFINDFRKTQSIFRPIVFISQQKPNPAFQAILDRNSHWNFWLFPLDHKEFMEMIKELMTIINALDEKIITLKKDGMLYSYNARNLSRVQRVDRRYIRIYRQEAPYSPDEGETFFYVGSLANFITDLGLEKYLKQANRSWLVNPSVINNINRASDRIELVLKNNEVVPTSRNHVKKFQIKK